MTPDGKTLAFTQMGLRLSTETKIDIWMLPLEGDRTSFPFVQTRFNEIHPTFSHDGRWLAYASDESGRYEVYVKPYPGPGGSFQISTEGGCEPVWPPDGKEIFYRSWDGAELKVRSFQSEPVPQVDKQSVLFVQPFLGSNPYGRLYDLAPDGERFLMIKPSVLPEGGISDKNRCL